MMWPGGEKFKLCMGCTKSPEYGYDYAAGTISCAEHGGTHVDAPFHFNAAGIKVDQITLSQLIGNCKVIDICDQCERDPDYAFTGSDIVAFEAVNGTLEQGDIVLIRTGWSHKYGGGPLAYLGFDEATQGPYTGDSRLQFPAIGEEAARVLVQRNVAAVGLDTGSLTSLTL